MRENPLSQQLLDNEPGIGRVRDPELAALLDMLFPDHDLDAAGKPVFSQEDSRALDALFERCGLRMRVENNTLTVVVEAYQFCTIYLGDFLNRAMRRPEAFEYLTRDWPDDWRKYAVSVVHGDKAESKRLASLLLPLAPDCPYPPLLRPFRDNGKPTPLASASRATV